jgi:acetyl/propionyl-CoA carboxylase alpha subunit
MFKSVLVANRGEIAVRIIRTLRRLGVRSVVVASIPDRRSMAVRHADAWVLLEGYSAAESYLDIEAVIAAAKAEGCEAIHPGYGFLAENADFAEACAEAGLVFIGPSAAVLRAVGDKAAARRLAVESGVPVVPGWDGEDDDATLLREAERIGAPLMVKARGGGGGRGMREVRDLAELPEALASARREAEAAFGDPRLLLERLVTGAHHVEVQVVADTHGNFVHLGERDCSVQRRHQKLIEETPSPVVGPPLREALTGAALRLARAVGYANAGTFEFLVGEPGDHRDSDIEVLAGADAPSRPFYFLEVNPRLQVEHPVTEEVTGIDLVEWQLRVAAGEPLPLRQEEVRFEGHAIEFRVNAEDPWQDFRPSGGRLTRLDWPLVVRVDAGFEPGDTVPSQYDSLLGKLVHRAGSRQQCLDDARALLPGAEIAGVANNLRLLASLTSSETLIRGEATVDWLEAQLPALLESARTPSAAWAAAGAALLVPAAGIGPGGTACWLSDGHEAREVRMTRDAAGPGRRVFVTVDGAHHGVELRANRKPDGMGVFGRIASARVDREEVEVAARGDEVHCWAVGRHHKFRLAPPPPLPRRVHTEAEGASAVVAPLAGTIASVRVAEGDTVEPGALLLTLEAMKMEHRISAQVGGTVRAVRVAVGDVVREGDVLVEVG